MRNILLALSNFLLAGWRLVRVLGSMQARG